jgi:hypothetical protein
VEPDGSMCGQLAELNYPSEYVAVALQLGNNDIKTVRAFVIITYVSSPDIAFQHV